MSSTVGANYSFNISSILFVSTLISSLLWHCGYNKSYIFIKYSLILFNYFYMLVKLSQLDFEYLFQISYRILEMGNIPEIISVHGFKKNSNLLLNIKLPKLRDYFAAFKSICDNFSIDLTQFQHIFGTGQSAFVIWDTDNNGLIDSLQLFAGIAIFADIKLQDKIRFLFDMFDFNQIDYLEPIQLQFMMYCACSASFKIFSITNEINNQEIEDFVKDIFFDYTKITVADLIRKGKQNKKIQDFFQAIKFNKNSTENNHQQQMHQNLYKSQFKNMESSGQID